VPNQVVVKIQVVDHGAGLNPGRGGIGEELIHPAHHKRRNAALRVVAGKLQN